VNRSVLWDGSVVEAEAKLEGSIVVSGGIVRKGERARDVVVLPKRALGRGAEVGRDVERRDKMLWVRLK
jgi:ADP-glucose pyrophosphorylase